MTSRDTPLVRTELAVILIGLSLLAPQLAGLSPRALTAQVPPESVQAAVGYAQHRLWSDFISGRREWAPAVRLPDPTLAEYRQFLAGLGLIRRGDVATLYVLPPLDRERISDRIEVLLFEPRAPILLKLYIKDPDGRSRCAGQVQIRVDADDVVTCQSESERPSRLLSYWPVRPGPVLP